MNPIAIAIHGGCGVMRASDLPEAEWADARDVLAAALRAGWSVLSGGGRSLDAVEAAIVVLEDSPHFNAGHGAALNAEGEHELDASIMDGAGLAAGAVIGVRRVRNPVRAARAVLETGLARGPRRPRRGPFRRDARDRHGRPLLFHHGTAPREPRHHEGARRRGHGVVGFGGRETRHRRGGGARRAGHLAAATSTGGYTNKPAGRVGDSPLIGAGTYARDGVCAVSGTGQGEAFIRHALAYDVAARMTYRGDGLDAATAGVLADLTPKGTGAGLIALDAKGRVAAPFNTGGMFRGWVTTEGEAFVATHAGGFPLGRLGRVSETAPIAVYVDADACPVKAEVYRVAERHGARSSSCRTAP